MLIIKWYIFKGALINFNYFDCLGAAEQDGNSKFDILSPFKVVECVT